MSCAPLRVVWRNTLHAACFYCWYIFVVRRPIPKASRSSICRKKKTWGNLMLLIKYLWKHVALLTTCSSFKKLYPCLYTFHGAFSLEACSKVFYDSHTRSHSVFPQFHTQKFSQTERDRVLAGIGNKDTIVQYNGFAGHHTKPLLMIPGTHTICIVSL